MATLAFMAGLDIGSTYAEILEAAGATSTNISAVVHPTDGIWGNQVVEIEANERGIGAAVTPSTWYHLGVIFKPLESTSFNGVLSQGDALTATSAFLNVQVRWLSDGSIQLAGDGGTFATTAPGIAPVGSWAFLELIVRPASSGEAYVYLNGVEILAVTGEDFLDGNSSAFAMFGNQNGGSDMQFDDPFCFTSSTNDFTVLGEWRVETLVPDGDTAQADFTGSYTDIDDPVPGYHDGDTTFISSATLNHESEFSMANLTATGIQSIQGVRTVIAARKEDVGVAEYTPYVVSGGSTADGTPPVLSTAYTYGRNIFETDPNGGGSWTESAVNASLLGVRITDV